LLGQVDSQGFRHQVVRAVRAHAVRLDGSHGQEHGLDRHGHQLLDLHPVQVIEVARPLSWRIGRRDQNQR
jgi:hypothetical protein